MRLARLAASPIRALARERPPAVANPGALHPGDSPPTGGRLLVLYDGGCGICLHVRDLLVVLDRRDRLAHDRILRHADGLLADTDPVAKFASWHTIHPDGRVEHGAQGVAAALEQLPAPAPLAARLVRHFPGPSDTAYTWFARNRGWISRGTGLIDHPQRDPREQPSDPRHAEVAGPGPGGQSSD